jgi:tRNA modification GTPase
MNALLEKERVIVTPIAGTTRDSIEETIYIKGIPVRLVDAAGIIEPKGLMEKMSVDKAQQCLKNAGLILFVIDGSQLLKKEDYLAAQHIKGKDYIAVVNKSDLPQRIRLDEVKAIVNDCTKIVSISATKNIGIGALKKHIFDFIWAGKTVDASDIVVTNARHKIALEEANKNLTGAVESLKLEFSYEFIAADVKDAINSLANITGQAVGDEVLDRIFSKFCIGK